jgi:hypothetical protein
MKAVSETIINAEKAKGNIRILPAGSSVRFDMEAGYLALEEAKKMKARIERILKRHSATRD